MTAQATDPDAMTRKQKLGYLFALFALIAAAVAVSITMFDVGRASHQRVTGTTRVTPEAVQSAANVKHGAFMPTIDSSAINKRVTSAMPWVQSVAVKKIWPSTLELQVHERTAVAMIETDAAATPDSKAKGKGPAHKIAKVSSDGTVVEVSDSFDTSLPMILDETVPASPGAKASPRAMRLIVLIGQVPDSLRPKLSQVQLKGDDDALLGLSTGTIVELGSIKEDLGAKLTSAAAVLAREDNKKIKSLDVRSPRMPLATPA